MFHLWGNGPDFPDFVVLLIDGQNSVYVAYRYDDYGKWPSKKEEDNGNDRVNPSNLTTCIDHSSAR